LFDATSSSFFQEVLKKKGKCISDYKVDLIINYNGIEHSYIEISDKVENKKAARFS
jgi:hypothetical protein